ncbi:hypothetical protein GCM10010869_02000 [Mesorhizobium tianshanense]|nr:hypothetical protein GCM10010869_02000 [Mesorhizobium tianshanense]
MGAGKRRSYLRRVQQERHFEKLSRPPARREFIKVTTSQPKYQTNADQVCYNKSRNYTKYTSGHKGVYAASHGAVENEEAANEEETVNSHLAGGQRTEDILQNFTIRVSIYKFLRVGYDNK